MYVEQLGYEKRGSNRKGKHFITFIILQQFINFIAIHIQDLWYFSSWKELQNWGGKFRRDVFEADERN